MARAADVALDPKTGGSSAVYSYLATPDIEVGDAVFVPLGARSVMGFVTRVFDATDATLGFPIAKLRPIQQRVEGLSLPVTLVELARFVADEYLCSLPVALSPCLPPGVKDRLVTAWTLAQPSAEHELTAVQAEVLRTMGELGGTILDTRSKPLPSGSVKALRHLRGKGFVRQSVRVAPFTERKRGEAMLQLTAEQGRIDEFLKSEGKRKPAQAVTLMRLQSATRAAFTVSEIKTMAQVTEATIKALADQGLLEATDVWADRVTSPPPLNLYQGVAVDAVCAAIAGRTSQPFLLFGVTGSGKTEVYMRAAAEALRMGRQILYLVPEIALAGQAIALLRSRFGANVILLHSELSATERLHNWMKIREGKAGIVVGARSAVFAPIENLGLAIVDEEHEAAYKQETTPRYHARTLARFLAIQHGAPIILGSATPSVETFYEVEQAETSGTGLTLLSLPERVAFARLPQVEIENLKIGYQSGKPAIITDALRSRMTEALARREQVILFLNRRAYAPFLMCRDCGFRFECPHCAVSLSYHQRARQLLCHHCGYSRRPMSACPNCTSARISPLGVGTERVEEAVAQMFPDHRIARLDRDIARRKGILEETLASFRSGEIDILVGTQLIAKGLDFPNVTLVGVIAADISLNIPDFRSSERTYQLLSQVAGRAGRGQAPGSVVIQTFNPEHPSVLAAAGHDYLPLFEDLKRERSQAGYPPFRKLINIVMSGENRAAVIRAAEDAKNRLERERLEVLGPVDCALERVQGRWRRHVLVKMGPQEAATPVQLALADFSPPGVQVAIDVDPYTIH